MTDAPSGGAPEQAPRWDLMSTEGCGGGIRFLAPYLIVWGYVGIYRRKEYVGGATGSRRYALEAIINDIIYLRVHNYVYVPCYNCNDSRVCNIHEARRKTHMHVWNNKR